MNFIICAFLSLGLTATIQSQTTFNDSLLKIDYNIFKTIGAELSPKFTLQDKIDFNAAFESHIEELNGTKMTALEFVDFLSKSKAKSKLDGHGQIILPEAITSALLDGGAALFPIPIAIIDAMVVVKSETVELPYGAIITSINDQPIDTIVDTLIRERSTSSLKNLENSFDIFYLIKYGIAKNFKVSFKTSSESPEETLIILPITIETRNDRYKNAVFPLRKDELTKTINTTYFEDTDCLYLQLNSFAAINGDKEKLYNTFNSEFKKIFKDLVKENTHNLIIDLRFNGGGDVEIPGLFYSFIAQKPFYQDITMRIPDFNFPFKNDITAIENKPIKDSTEVNEFIKWHKRKLKFINGQYEYKLADNEKIVPQKSSFKGTVYLLIGGRTASAASYFTALFKAEKRGIIVGEKIGGTHHDLTAGKIIDYTLPNTKIIIRMPIATVSFSHYLETELPERLIHPDVELETATKYHYFIQKEDAELQTIFNLIKNRKIQSEN